MFFDKQFKTINDRLDDLEKENAMLKRILKYSKEDSITSYSVQERIDDLIVKRMEFLCRYITYIYKDGCEYKFSSLYLKEPKFKPGSKDNIVIVNDENNEYILDLITCKYIKTK